MVRITGPVAPDSAEENTITQHAEEHYRSKAKRHKNKAKEYKREAEKYKKKSEKDANKVKELKMQMKYDHQLCEETGRRREAEAEARAWREVTEYMYNAMQAITDTLHGRQGPAGLPESMIESECEVFDA